MLKKIWEWIKNPLGIPEEEVKEKVNYNQFKYCYGVEGCPNHKISDCAFSGLVKEITLKDIEQQRCTSCPLSLEEIQEKLK